MKEVIVLEKAEEDLVAGKAFYDDNEPGVGDYFISCLLSDLSALRLYAEVHPFHFGYQRMLSKRFPFAIYYEDVPDENIVRVVAVLDARRNPRMIRKSLKMRRFLNS